MQEAWQSGVCTLDEEKHSLPQAGGGNFTSWAKTTWATDRCSKQA
jgi:hypothetical protein